MGLINNLITRFPNGVSDAGVADIIGQMPFPTKYLVDFYSFFDDFMHAIPAGTTDWTITNAGGGSLANGGDAGGSILITTGSSVVGLQNNQAIFVPAVGKRLFGRIRFKCGDPTNTIIQIGLVIKDTSPNDATDGIFLYSPDASAVLSLYAQSAATVTTGNTPVVTMVADTYYSIMLYYDGVDRLYFSTSGVAGYLSVPSANLPDVAAGILPSIAATNGASGSAETLEVDTIWFSQER